MTTPLFRHARFGLSMVHVVVLALLISLLVPPHTSDADESGVLWSSAFGDGTEAAFASIGDGAPSTGWNSRANSSFGPHAGRDAWHIHAPTGARDGVKLRTKLTDLDVTPQAALQLDYDVFIPDTQTLEHDFKLPGIASAPHHESVWYASSGGTKQPDSASLRLHARPAGNWGMTHHYLEAYTYAESGGGKTFDQWGLYWRLADDLNATGHARGDEMRIPIGEWFTISMQAHINTPGNADGQLRVWLNGHKGIDLNDMNWVTHGHHTWTQTMFDTFYNDTNHHTTTIHIANMQLTDPTDPSAVEPDPVVEPEPIVDPEPEPEPIVEPDPIVEPEPEPVPATTTHFAFDTDTEGWEPGQNRDKVTHERTVVHDGTGALRGRTNFRSNSTGSMRFRSPGEHRNWFADDNTVGAWVYVPADAGGSNWQARLEVQNSSDWGYTNGELQSVTPGQWNHITHDFGTALSDTFRIAVHVQAWNVGGHRTIYLDTITQTAPTPIAEPTPEPEPIVEPEPVVEPEPEPGPATTTHFAFDSDAQDWEPGQSGDEVTHERSIVHDGAGSLRGRSEFGSNTTGTMRFRSPGQHRNWSADDNTLGAWVYVPADAGGSNWQARLEVQNSADWGYTNGELQSVTPGQWNHITHDFGTALSDTFRVAVHVQAWNVGGHRDIHLDTITQGAD